MKITAPNKDFDGYVGGVAFLKGEGETDNVSLAHWFAVHGYSVEGIDSRKVTTIEQDPRAGVAAVGTASHPGEDASVSKGMTDEQRRKFYGDNVGPLLVSPTGAPVIGPARDTTEYASDKDRARLLATTPGKGQGGKGLTAGRGDNAKIEAPQAGGPTEEVKGARGGGRQRPRAASGRSRARRSAAPKAGDE